MPSEAGSTEKRNAADWVQLQGTGISPRWLGLSVFFKVHWLDPQPSILSLMRRLCLEAAPVSPNKVAGADWTFFHTLERQGMTEIGLLQETGNIQT